jgi:hypothetical protein
MEWKENHWILDSVRGGVSILSHKGYIPLLSENLTEKVILNLTDCDSLSNHITTKTTDEKVIYLT